MIPRSREKQEEYVKSLIKELGKRKKQVEVLEAEIEIEAQKLEEIPKSGLWL